MRRIDWLAVTALLLFAAGLRIIGIGYGRLNPEYFPSYAPFGMVHEQLPIQPDEFFNVAIPVNMALRNQLNPEFFELSVTDYEHQLCLISADRRSLDGAVAGRARRVGRCVPTQTFSLYVFSRNVLLSFRWNAALSPARYAISRQVALDDLPPYAPDLLVATVLHAGTARALYQTGLRSRPAG